MTCASVLSPDIARRACRAEEVVQARGPDIDCLDKCALLNWKHCWNLPCARTRYWPLFGPPSMSSPVCPFHPEYCMQHSTSRQYVGDHGLLVLAITEPPASQHQRIVRRYLQ